MWISGTGPIEFFTIGIFKSVCQMFCQMFCKPCEFDWHFVGLYEIMFKINKGFLVQNSECFLWKYMLNPE